MMKDEDQGGGIADPSSEPGKVADPAQAPKSDPQPAPSTPTQPGGEPSVHPHDPIKPQEVEHDENKNPIRPAQQAGGVPLNFKVKVGDEEKEIEEWARGLLNPENEKQFKRLYEKAYGLDIVVNKLRGRTEEFQKVKQEHDGLQNTLSQLSASVRAGDLNTFFEATGISKEKVIKYVIDELEYGNLPPEQRQARDQHMQIARRAQMLELENKQLLQQSQQAQTQYEQFLVQSRESELNSVMSRPEVASISQAFDQREGRPGAFRDEVVALATAEFYRTGSDLSSEQAVNRVLRLMGQTPGHLGSTQGQPNFQTQTISQGPGKPPVIPNVGGKNTSPTRRSPRSLDELKQIADAL